MHPHPYWRYHRRDWQHGIPHKRRFLFVRFVFMFGALIFLFMIALAITVVLATDSFQGAFPRNAALVVLVCAVPFGFVMLVGVFAGWAFRRFGGPVAEVMAAADAVAEGDLSVRVREQIPGEFGRLARSFNRMTAELERSEQQRRNLAADVAHELRTPLHIIQGNLEGMIDGVYRPDPEFIEATLEETRLLNRLVSDLQTLSLAEAGQLPLHRLHVSTGDLLSDAATSFSGQAAELGVELDVAPAAKNEALEIEVDPDRIGQVLNNLVANALRHTPEGGRIRLTAEPIPGGVRVSVEDNGAGIPAEDLPFIFDRFWKGDRSRARQAGVGSGLGLAIARQLVQAHGGKIYAESKPGEWTRFTFELPNPL